MLKKILLGLAAVIVILAIVVALQPADFRIERTATIAAPPAKVFAQVNELKNWDAWSPWAKRDPKMKMSYEGPPAGAGAVSAWAGNSEVGEGRMTIIESRPAELVRFKLEFFKPMEGTSTAEFSFRPAGEQTAVTWRMEGKNNFVARAMCLVMDMDKMVGGDFEQGLAGLKSIAERK